MLAGLGIALIQALMPAPDQGPFRRAHSAWGSMSPPSWLARAVRQRRADLAEHAGWRLGLGAWAALAALALLAWWLQPGTRLRLPAAQPGRSLLRYPRTWLLVLFFGLGTACYTCVLAWLAPYYLEQGWSAQESGLLLGFLTAMEVLSGLLAPALASRSRDRRPVLVGLTALMLAGFRPRLGAGQPAAALGAVPRTGHRRAVPHGLDRLPRPLRRAATRRSTGCPGTRRRLPDRRVSPWIAGLLRDSLGSFTGAWLGLTAAARCWDWVCASTHGAMRHCSPSGRREASPKLALRKGRSDGAPDAVRTPRC